jgi:uncharacterized repeat protein (TIGR03803 family)
MGKSMKKNKNYKMLAIGLLTLAVVSAAVPAHAQYSLLYSFGVSSATDAVDPPGQIAQGEDGSLYSTGEDGGATGWGAVWKITPAGKETVVFNFCPLPVTCADHDGNTPITGLMLRPDGHFLGTTGFSFGLDGPGTIYDVSQTGSFSKLFSAPSGTVPGIPIWGPDGSFYGLNGGGADNCGTVYRLSTTYTVIHTFDRTHGCSPSNLVLGTDGSIYGTTGTGGSSNAGVFFKLTYRPGLATLYSVLANFSSALEGPGGALVEDSDGNFYGLTGGSGTPGGPYGSVFRVTPTGVLTTLHTLNGTTDGAFPTTLTFASDGNLYGTAVLGGAEDGGGFGTLFQITTAGAYTVLYRFTGPNSGAGPFALVQHTNGLLYGTTANGGAFSGSNYDCSPNNGCGVVYSWNGSLPAFVSTVQLMGAVGSEVEILGQGFTSSSIVSFNGVPATATVQSGTSLHATVPVGATTGSITVTTSTGTLTSNRQFVVLP